MSLKSTYFILSIFVLPQGHHNYDEKVKSELNSDYWVSKSQDVVKEKAHKQFNKNIAKNVIFFLGDGLSVQTLSAARIHLGQREGATGEEKQLSFEKFPVAGLVKTYCVNAQIPDSACTATAYLVGVKNNMLTIGVTANVSASDCAASQIETNRLESIAQRAINSGKSAGIVTTTRVTHASPAGAFAKTANKFWESDLMTNLFGVSANMCPDIAKQLVFEEPGNQFKVILGGGRRNFRNLNVLDEEGDRGLRVDGLDLIEEWKKDKITNNASYSYVWNRDQLLNIDYQNTDFVLGLFESSHLMYNLETNPETEPSLTDMTEAAINILSKNDKGYFVFIEAGRIDHGHHNNQVQIALDETIELHKAVERAVELTSSEDTLIVVSSDHGHTMAFNGYSVRGNSILGPSESVGSDGMPYMTLSYTNGPGFQAHVEPGIRRNPLEDYLALHHTFQYPAEVPLSIETHGGDDVAVFAFGPHELLFTGLYEQSDIPHLMAYAACIGDGYHACSSTVNRVSKLNFNSFFIACAFLLPFILILI